MPAFSTSSKGEPEMNKRMEIRNGLVAALAATMSFAAGASPHAAAADVAGCSNSVCYAETEWRRWLENVSGAADLRVRFVRTDEHGDDGFRIQRSGGGEVRISGGRRGVIYGAHELLERFAGVVFCTSWFTYVPDHAALSIPPDIDITEKPAFLRREAGWADAFLRHPEFSVRCRFNGWRSHIPDYMGGMVVRYGGQMSHSLSALLPPEKYAKDHPEWFSEIDGVRRTAYTQPCFSNVEARNQVLSNMLAEIRRKPDANVFAISQNDNRNHCRCSRCVATYEEEGSITGAMLRFANSIAEEIEKVRPDLMIQFPAYQDTRMIPKKTRPRHNVMVNLCSIDADFALPLAESDAPGSREFVELLNGWSKLVKRFYVWHYTTNYRHYLHPLPNIHNIPRDIRLFRDSGATHLHMQGGHSHAAFAELKEWLIAKLSWNPDLDEERLIDVFCRAYYGAGAPFVKEIIADEENCVRSRKVPRMSIFSDDRPAVFTDEFLERSRERWRKAEAAVGDDRDRLHHLRMGEMATVTTMMDRIADSAKWVWATEHPERFAQDPRFPELYGWMKVAREESKRTGGVRFSELRGNEAWFLEKWDRAMRPNRPSAGAKSGRATADELCLLMGSGNHQIGRRIADPAAECGRAIEVFTHKNGDVVKLPFANVAFDPGARYLVRARIRVAKKAGGHGEAFYASISRNWKPVKECFRTVAEVSDGYEWYDIGEVEPRSSMWFGFGCGRFSKGGGRKAVDAVFIDSIEFRKL